MRNSRRADSARQSGLVALALLVSACSASSEPSNATNATHDADTADPKMVGVTAAVGGAATTAGKPSIKPVAAGTSAPSNPGRASPSAGAGAGAVSRQPALPSAAGAAALPSAGRSGMSGSSAAAGSGAAMTSAGAAGLAMSEAGMGGSVAAAESLPDLGEGDGSDIVTIGDSWMNFVANGGGIEAALDRLDTRYAHYAIPGTLLLNGQIPSQYDQAKQAHPKISTVILTAGGNDIMAANGCETKEKCAETVQEIIDGLDKLFMKMVQDGVTSTVYIVYSKSAGSGPKDTRPDVLPVPTICSGGKLRCLVVETTDIVGTSDLVDGVHPTQAACDRIAMRTLDMMKQQGLRR